MGKIEGKGCRAKPQSSPTFRYQAEDTPKKDTEASREEEITRGRKAISGTKSGKGSAMSDPTVPRASEMSIEFGKKEIVDDLGKSCFGV